MNPTEQAFTINITYDLEDCVDCDIIRVSKMFFNAVIKTLTVRLNIILKQK